ncbi:26597_t:CDS:2 [Dentiscutata erythropus]|uniref:26597_t:CDS:1 n=1 Tax=Dentiscutata erythropus TaxID=1348616 RepID=A0A9N9DTU8_9GLOM|nr:26597_t:CDS:2 [Dentiscutata erythropus]
MFKIGSILNCPEPELDQSSVQKKHKIRKEQKKQKQRSKKAAVAKAEVLK